MPIPVPEKEGVRPILFVGREYPPAYRQGRLMLTLDFIEALEERLPINARVVVLKHADPSVGDYSTHICMPPDTQVYELLNDGVRQPLWSIIGHANFR